MGRILFRGIFGRRIVEVPSTRLPMLSVRPDCPDGKTPGITGVSGDNWAPIADSKNDYVQIGLSGSTISITLVDALAQTLFGESSTLMD